MYTARLLHSFFNTYNVYALLISVGALLTLEVINALKVPLGRPYL